MVRSAIHPGVVAVALLGGVFACTAGEREYSFDRGERDDYEKGVVVKEEKKGDKAKREREANARAAGMHIKNLKDKDPAVRENSAEMLGMLGSVDAVPYLIEALRDNQRHVMVQIKAHGALNKITGKNFGYKNYREWHSWWMSNRDEFLKRAEAGPTQMDELRAKTSNTLGLGYLRTGQFAQARKMFLDAVNKDPQIPDYRNNLGLSVMELGDYISAIVYFEETVGLNDALPQPYMNIGTCYARMNKHIEAQHWFRKAMRRDKDGTLWEPFWTLGKEYLKKREFEMAKEFLEQASEKSSRKRIYDPRIYRDLALTYYGLDMYNSSWWAIRQVRRDGYDLDKGFVKKVRDALAAQGVDPEKTKTTRRKGFGEFLSAPAGTRPKR